MKKLLILSAAVLGAVACSNTYEVKTAPEKAIGFGTWTETLTKARATAGDNTAFQAGDAFDIYGFKTIGAANYVVFNGDPVTASVSSGSTVTWDYTPHRFWDPAAASYTFFAVLPAGKLATAPAETGLFVSNDIPFNAPDNFSDDILVADKKVVNGTGASAPYSYSGTVEMKFNHVASSVDLLVKQNNTLGGAVVKITALSLLNIHNSGHFTVSEYSANVPTVTWAEAATPAYLNSGEYVVLSSSISTDDITVAGETTYAGDHSASGTTGTAATIFSGYVFMPQDITADDQKIKLSYTIQVGSEEPIVYNDVVFDIRNFMTTDTDNNSGTPIATWAPKTKYIYTITIGSNNAIEFSASVKNWEAADVNGYHYLVN